MGAIQIAHSAIPIQVFGAIVSNDLLRAVRIEIGNGTQSEACDPTNAFQVGAIE